MDLCRVFLDLHFSAGIRSWPHADRREIDILQRALQAHGLDAIHASPTYIYIETVVGIADSRWVRFEIRLGGRVRLLLLELREPDVFVLYDRDLE